MTPQRAKAVLKITLLVASILSYGAIHKADKKLGEMIEDHYKPETEPTPED